MTIVANEKYVLKGSQIEDLASKINAKQEALDTDQLAAVNSGIVSNDVTKLGNIESGAQVNVQADWTEADTTSDAFIKNKPTIPSAQVQSDWDQSSTTAVDYIKNKPNLSDYPIITVQSTDPGEGVTLAANHFIACYEAS